MPAGQLRLPIAGQCDSTGNLTLSNIQVSASFFAAFTAILQVSAGSPQWTLTLSQAPIGFAGGQKVVLGSIYTDPTERVTLTVVGAAPSAVVTGGFYGFLADSPELLPQIGFSSGSASGGGGAGALPSGQAVIKATLPATPGGQTLIAIPCGGSANIGIEFTGIIWATTTLLIEGTIDDVIWQPLPAFFVRANPPMYWLQATALSGSAQNPSYFLVPCAGLSQIRVNWTPGGTQGNTVALTMRATPGGEFPLPIGQTLAAQSQPVVLASDQSAIPVTLAATQRPLAYQNRVEFAATALTIATVNAEAMLTLVPVRAGVASAGVTTIPVTAGKRLRITEFTGEFRNNAAATHVNQFTLKTNPSGAVIVTSPTLNRIELYAVAALANTGQQQSVPFPDGLEFAGTDQIGVSHLSDAAAIGFGTVSLTGFEYTP